MIYTQFQVGEKFPLPMHAQGDGGLFQYDCNGMTFILRLSNSDLIAAEAFRTGRLEIGLFKKQGILFFLYKIDGVLNGWGDCPYHASYLDTNHLPNLKENHELHLFLVDSQSELIVSIRKVCVSDEFQHILRQTVQNQLDFPFIKTDYIRKVQAVWNSHTSQAMADEACWKEEFAFSLTKPNFKKA